MARKKTPAEVETAILDKSRRRCCICYGLHRDASLKNGQIAHLDQNAANPALDNLAWLCLEHHNAYDSKTSQSKGMTLAEVKLYREELYRALQKQFTGLTMQTSLKASSPLWDENVSDLLREARGNRLADKIIEYRCHHGPLIGLCRLRIYRGRGGKPAVIVTQFPDNPGTSITNVAEALATQVYTQELKRPAQGMTWIEHYTPYGDVPETYMLVSFRTVGENFSDPEWEELTSAQVKTLVEEDRI